MSNIIEQNAVIDMVQPNGDIHRMFPVTTAECVIGLNELSGPQTKALKLLAVNSYIVDDTTGKTYKICMNEGKAYFKESEVSVLDLLNTIVDATTPDNEPPKE